MLFRVGKHERDRHRDKGVELPGFHKATGDERNCYQLGKKNACQSEKSIGGSKTDGCADKPKGECQQ